MIFSFITRESSNYPISNICDSLDINRSTYYAHNEAIENMLKKLEHINFICQRIYTIFLESHGIYGSPKIAAILRKEGIKISQKTVLKYMNILGIKSLVYENFKPHKSNISDQELSLIVNLIKNFTLTDINQVWVCDITYIKTKYDGTVYLASIMDLFSRKIIAWKVSSNMKKDLVIEVFKLAHASRKPIHIVIVHSDKGSQYRSYLYRKTLIDHNCVFSYTSINHSCDENANQESFHSLIKKEWLYNKNLFTLHDVVRECQEYIEGFYNSKRIHSSLGYLSPIEFEKQHFSKKNSKTPSKMCPKS